MSVATVLTKSRIQSTNVNGNENVLLQIKMHRYNTKVQLLILITKETLITIYYYIECINIYIYLSMFI